MNLEEHDSETVILISTRDFMFCSECNELAAVLAVNPDGNSVEILAYCKKHFEESGFGNEAIQSRYITQ